MVDSRAWKMVVGSWLNSSRMLSQKSKSGVKRLGKASATWTSCSLLVAIHARKRRDVRVL